MELTWRWFGRKDPITLDTMRQIGVQGVVTSLYHTPNGSIWNYGDIVEMRNHIQEHKLRWSVVESLPVSEAIKYGAANRDELIDNYVVSLENLGKAGITTVCYNFMPVIDWIRTDLNYKCDDGSVSLYFDKIKFAYFEYFILGRKAAINDYTPEQMEQVVALDKVITKAEKDELVYTIITKTQGFISGNFTEGDKNPVEKFNDLLALYKGIGIAELRENLRYFLQRIMPVCDKWGINMSIHPDDPPFQVLGLPRIVTCTEDIDWILRAVDNPHNGLTFCAGSLSASEANDLPKMARIFASRTHFVHLRSTQTDDKGNFFESSHLGGRAGIVELVKIFEAQKPSLPMRVDHGRVMLDDAGNNYNPGYPLIGRMYALAQIMGIIKTVNSYE